VAFQNQAMVPFSGKEPGGPLGLSHSQSPGTTETCVKICT